MAIVKSLLGRMGFEIRRKEAGPGLHRFSVAGIEYYVDPCSVGETPQGALTADGAVRMIRQRGLRGLRILDLCCGVGIVGLTILARLREEQVVDEISFADINIFNLNSLKRTLRLNDLTNLLGKTVHCWLSDGLASIPKGSRFDLIISNPPHYFIDDTASQALSPDQLGTFDAGWSFHSRFYQCCHEFLSARGEVWFLENGEAVRPEQLLGFVEQNPALEFVRVEEEPGLPSFYWMISRMATEG